MLQPANRLTLIDAMRPPVAFRLQSAMAVTFTLDLRALLAAPAAMAFTEAAGIADDGGAYEPIELIHALRSHANKITVFSQVGEIALPPSRRVFAFLERAVVPVDAPHKGVVHPKVWVLRYEAVGEQSDSPPREQRLRVLIASRNLTFDASWDTVVRLDEASHASGALLGPVGELFEGLLDAAEGAVAPGHRERVRSLSAALATARFALPTGVDELRTHVLGLRRTSSPLPAVAERSMIISPFVSDDFFATVRPERVDELVSRPESLDLLRPGTLDRADKVHVFDDGSVPDVGPGEQSSPDDPGRPLAGLHAKVFAFENKGQARLFLGSANATGAAFNNNVEILVELIGPASVLGIDRLCDGTGDEPGLRDLLNPYGGPDTCGETSGDPSPLDRARRVIARLPFEGIVEESGSEWAVTYRSRQPVPNLDGTKVFCWPLATAGHRRRVAAGEPLEVRFETSLETISGFLAFELADGEGRLTRFAVPTPLFGVPDHRERFLLRALIGNAERFLRYLLALLDEDSGQMDLRETVESVSDTADADGGGPSLPVLERLLRTMRRDPAKLVALHPLVSDLADDDALPPGFAGLWTMIFDVALAGDVEQ